jgi:hypothetical protein
MNKMCKECLPEKAWRILYGLRSTLAKYGVVLSGGTALALHLGHRISVDLDFFTNMNFNVEFLISEIRKTGYPYRIISEGEGYLIVDLDGIKVSFFKYDYPFLEKQVVYKGVYVAGILDIASMKVIAMSQRGTKRDFVDLFFILQDTPFHNVAEHMVKRFRKERINPIHIGKSLVYFYDADSNPEPEYIKGKEISWDNVKKFFRHHVKQFVFDLSTATS